MANASGEFTLQRTIRRQQLREIVPLADSTIYEMERRGEFPRRFALTPRCVVWDLGEIQAWLAARRAKPILKALCPDVRQRRIRPVKGQDRVAGSTSKAK
ncbi:MULTISPECIES: helix-turn-helix transcriptional regulator [Phyllobacteriaceae]|jgi:prophage regulatory protein|uniref:helix-turn-helix transcriptional regulator n=1 Tax=Phyllobacteriaceae TaxID=69277 RepID=UPI0009F686BD|nr:MULTISPECIES: AlpA family phage regulatory protein [Mesorhizobium]MBN9235640.1 AlpA family phage regulatory protein [Mesorhizobium sp.]